MALVTVPLMAVSNERDGIVPRPQAEICDKSRRGQVGVMSWLKPSKTDPKSSAVQSDGFRPSIDGFRLCRKDRQGGEGIDKRGVLGNRVERVPDEMRGI